MTARKDGNVNTNDTPTTTTVLINSVTATTLLAANPKRLWIRVSMDSGITNEQAFVREYPAATDNTKHGELLIRDISSNHSLFKPCYFSMPDNIFTGELSAIAITGSFNLHITEG